MDDKVDATAGALELLMMNQIALRAAIEAEHLCSPTRLSERP
jgi:hypothetical protein